MSGKLLARRYSSSRAHFKSCEVDDVRRFKKRLKTTSNENFAPVRAMSRTIWRTLSLANRLPPYEGHFDQWIALDRGRALQRRLVKEWNDPLCNAMERQYQRALTSLIESVSGLVWMYARKMATRAAGACLDVDDLVQEAMIHGVMRAVETFEPARGFAFNTYSHFWIYQSMNKAIQFAGIVRIPINAKEEAAKPFRTSTYLEDMNTKQGDPLQRKVGPDAFLADTSLTAADIQLEAYEDDKILVSLIAKLEPKHLEVLTARYWGEKTLDEIGKDHSICRERVRQIEQSALEHLRHHARHERRRRLS